MSKHRVVVGLSGGVDSSAVVALMSEQTRVKSFSIGFTDTKQLMTSARVLPGFQNAAVLTDDGVPRTLPSGTIPFLNDLAYGVQAGKGAALALGKDAEARVKALLHEPASSDPPLMVMAYDMARFGTLMSQVSGAAGGMPSEMQLLLDFYKSIGVVTYDARATARGTCGFVLGSEN